MGLKKCRNCNLMHPSAKRTCSCGYQFEIKSKKVYGAPSTNYNELIMQQQHVLKQLTAQRPLSASACAAVANLIQVTSAAISANENQAGLMMDEGGNQLEGTDMSMNGSSGSMLADDDDVEDDDNNTMMIKPEFANFGKDNNLFDNQSSQDTFKVESAGGEEQENHGGLDISASSSSHPVDLSSGEKCSQETVENFMKLVQGENESNSGGFDGDTVTVMQQPITSSVPTQRGAEDFVGGGMDVFGRQIGSPNLGAPKKRGRPPGSNWLRQQRDFMALQASLSNCDGDSMLPTMVPPTSRPSGPSTGSTMDQRSNGVHGNSGVGLPFGSGIRKLTAAGNFPRPRGRPRGSFSSVRRLSTAREYLEFTRAYHQLRNQMKFANRMRLPADYKSSVNSAASALGSSTSTNVTVPNFSVGDAPTSLQTAPTELSPGISGGGCGTLPTSNSDDCGTEDIMMSEGNSPMMESLGSPQSVLLDVAGQAYYTSMASLNKFPNSNLFKLTLGSEDSGDVSERGRLSYFIDRDPTVFEHILNYVRSDRLCLPSDFKNFELLQIEATFYDIPGLISEVERHRHKSGRIETTKREYSESHYILMEVSRTSKAIEISGAKKTIDSIFNINSNLAVGATNCLYYQQLRLSESVKNLAPAEAVDKILGTGAFKIFKVSTITIENEPTTSYHFVVQ